MSLVLLMTGAAVPITAGAFVVHRSRRHPVGWLLVVHGVGFAMVLGVGGPHAEGAGLVADQLLSGAWVFLFAGVALAVYLVPDGKPASDRWRRWIIACLVGVALFLIGAPGDRTGFVARHDGVEPPVVWIPEPLSALLGVTGLVGVVGLLAGAVVSTATRLRGSTGVERQQLLWMMAGALPIPIALTLGWVDHFLAGGSVTWLFDIALVLASVSLPIAIAVAIARHQLFDIRLLLSHCLTYLALAVLVIVLYTSAWLLSGTLSDSGTSGGVVAVALVALIAHPTSVVVHRRVERWVHGYGSAPYLAVQRVAMRSAAADTDGLVDAVLRATAEALGAERARLELDGPRGEAVRVPIVVGQEELGVLALDMPPDRQGAIERALLEDISRYVALVVRGQRLNDQLRASQDRLLESRAQERRRLHRDLHDGLGPTLAAIALKLDVARRRSAHADVDEILDEVRVDAQHAVDEIRRVVEGLRPTALEEAGLMEALRIRARSLSTDTTNFYLNGPDHTPPLPPLVEDAAYRIASEAMTNTSKHANARHCLVEITIDEMVVITVSDDGDGIAPQSRSGAGLRTMAERSTELGGSFNIGPGQVGGTEIQATLPLEFGAWYSQEVQQS